MNRKDIYDNFKLEKPFAMSPCSALSGSMYFVLFDSGQILQVYSPIFIVKEHFQNFLNRN